MMIKRRKRGRGPLIAGILLVALAVAVIGFFVAWGRGYLNDFTEDTDKGAQSGIICLKEVNFNVVGGCFDSNVVKFSIDNRAGKEISGLIFRLIYDDESVGVVSDSEVKSGNVPINNLILESFEIEYDNTRTIEHIEVIPKIHVDGVDIVCVQNSQSKYLNNEC